MNHDDIHHFLMEAHKISQDAQFIVDSLPNAEVPAVERVTHQLSAIRTILTTLHDPHSSPQAISDMVTYVNSLLLPLDDFLTNPPPPASTHIPRNSTGGRGRPAYVIDLDRAVLLHDLGNTWTDVAKAMGVVRQTLYNQMDRAGRSTARKEWTEITDDQLDERVSEISLQHPFSGSSIIAGHLESQGVHVAKKRVQDSLRQVDEIGVLVRWSGIIKRRIYKVWGANALCHNDGNEKLRPWGFWVHGCIDGHSRLIIYLECRSNKRSATVGELFMNTVRTYGWPSRGRGDFGKENNQMEAFLIAHWGQLHRAYLRGRSLHNIRIERLWRDIRKDTLEAFRQIFIYLTDMALLDMKNSIHSSCLFLVFQRRIQASLDRSRDGWNHHTIRTERNKTPVAIYELSRETAINRGYWTGDPGHDGETVANDPLYGYDGEAPLPPAGELADDPTAPEMEPTGIDAQRDAGICLNDDDELAAIRELLPHFDFDEDDGNWGIDVYCRAVVLLSAIMGVDSVE